jgi:membrane-associated phospholipid phosphatase
MTECRSQFCWPTRNLWWIFLSQGTGLVVVWILVYGGCSWLTSLHSYRVRLHFDWELAIPFWPELAIVYLSLFPMLWLSPFVLSDEFQLRRFAQGLGWLFALSGIGFLLVPGDPAYISQPVPHLWLPIFNFADRVNLEHNMFPSLHVSMAILCAFAYSQHAKLWIRLFYWAWGSAIIAATVLTHQHHVVDLLAGALLAAVVSRRFVCCKEDKRGTSKMSDLAD